MRNALALNLFHEPGSTVPALIDEFAQYGFDGFSFGMGMMLELDPGEARESVERLQAGGLGAVLHIQFRLTPAEADRLLELFGETLLHVTFDSVQVRDSRGSFYDAARMAEVLGDLAKRTEGTDIRFGVEDFPLDAAAADYYREQLGEVWAHPRCGILVDLGHMNVRLAKVPYYSAQTPGDYLANLPLEVIELHVHDNPGDRDMHMPLGDGNLDLDAVATGLRGIGFDGVATLEIAPAYHGTSYADERPRVQESLGRWRRLWRSV